VSPKANPKTGQIQYCVVEAPDVPVEIRVITGEIIQSLRSALDYLIVQLLDVEMKQPDTRTGFPIYDSRDKFEAEFLGKIKLIQRQSSIDAIRATKPYKGGNDTLWKLHWLNIRDKHHMLFVVGMAFASIDAFGHFKRIGAMPTEIETKGLRWRPVGKSRICPLKVGDVLFTSPSAEVDQQIE